MFKPNFIDDIAHYITHVRNIGTPKLWAETIAGQLVSATIRRPIITPTQWTPIRGVRLTSADVNNSPSQTFFKGLPVQNIMHPILLKFNQLETERLFRLTGTPLERPIDVIIPATMTSKEGLLDHMSMSEHKYGIEWQAEVGELFRTFGKSGQKLSSYQVNEEHYTKLLDHVPLKRRLSRKKKGEKFEWYISEYNHNFLGATSDYMFQVVDKTMFMQGWAIRINWTYKTGRNPSGGIPKTMFDVDYKRDIVENSGIIRKYAEFLVWLNRQSFEVLSLSRMDNSQQKIWQFDQDNLTLNDDEDIQPVNTRVVLSFQSREWLKAVVLAQKHAIGNLWALFNKKKARHIGKFDLFITESDVDWALNKVHEHHDNMLAFLREWTKVEQEQARFRRVVEREIPIERVVKRILKYLKFAKDVGMTAKEITHKFGQGEKTWGKGMEQLIRNGSVVKEILRKALRGKETTIYRLREYRKPTSKP